RFLTTPSGLLGAWLLLACWAAPASAQPQDIDAYTVPLGEGLGYILDNDVGHSTAAYIIFRAGKSGDEAYRDELREIVERYTGNYQKSGLILAAMHALWELGEDGAYFRDIALRWREDEWNARAAMNVLALSPTPENLAASRQVADEATSGLLTGAYS